MSQDGYYEVLISNNSKVRLRDIEKTNVSKKGKCPKEGLTITKVLMTKLLICATTTYVRHECDFFYNSI